ncbi:MAG: hypothetical protein Q8K97_05520 [Pseudohongiella sp.]|nr:hypothetical protein [Pseudohongiella sp.]
MKFRCRFRPDTLHTLRSQSGAALLVFFVLLFSAAAAVGLRALNNSVAGLDREANISTEMAEVKEILLSFGMLYPGSPGATTGPGMLPCKDSDNDGIADATCNTTTPGRLATGIPNTQFTFSSRGGADDQFWYALSPGFRLLPGGIVNTTTAGTLSFDGVGDIAAVVIHAGQALTGQSRTNSAAVRNNPANYLESTNVTGPAFVSSLPPPQQFNDRVIAISGSEMRTAMALRVVADIKTQLDTYHPANAHTYPADADFAAAMSQPPGLPTWFTTNNWGAVTSYTFLNSNEATIQFSSCAIVFTLTFGQPGITRTVSSC